MWSPTISDAGVRSPTCCELCHRLARSRHPTAGSRLWPAQSPLGSAPNGLMSFTSSIFAAPAMALSLGTPRAPTPTECAWSAQPPSADLGQRRLHHPSVRPDRPTVARSSRTGHRSILLIQLARTRRYESWLAHQFDRVLLTSELDRRALAEIAGPRAPLQVLPNGVDLDYFQPATDPREPATIVISGKMSYHANVSAALHLVQDIMPCVWAQRQTCGSALLARIPLHSCARWPRAAPIGRSR